MYLLPWALLALAATALDVISKMLVVRYLPYQTPLVLLDGVFQLTYIKNAGASFGILAGGRWLFVFVTVLLIGALLGYTIKKKMQSKLFLLAAAFVIGGGIGNLIDRLRMGAVVDFFDFCLINFPIFNVADCFVVIGAILMGIYCIREEWKERKQHTTDAGKH